MLRFYNFFIETKVSLAARFIVPSLWKKKKKKKGKKKKKKEKKKKVVKLSLVNRRVFIRIRCKFMKMQDLKLANFY